MPSISPKTGSELGKIRTFLFDHERLLIVVVLAISVLSAIYWGLGKYQEIQADHDNKALAAAKLQSDAQAAANAKLDAQVQADKVQLQQLTDKLTAQNTQLEQANIQLVSALKNQQKTDATLPPTQLAARWQQLVPFAPPASVNVATSGNMEVTPAASVATVQTLEQVPVLQKQLDNETAQKAVPVLQKQLDNETAQKANVDLLLGAANKSIFDLNASLDGAKKLDGDHQTQCKAEEKVMTDDFNKKLRKARKRWFIVGYVAGFLSRQAIKTYTGF